MYRLLLGLRNMGKMGLGLLLCTLLVFGAPMNGFAEGEGEAAPPPPAPEPAPPPPPAPEPVFEPPPPAPQPEPAPVYEPPPAPEPIFEPEPTPVYEPEPLPQPDYHQPEPVYNESEPVYNEPDPIYGEPDPVYPEPDPIYGEPDLVYPEPEPVYPEPEPVYGETNSDFPELETPPPPEPQGENSTADQGRPGEMPGRDKNRDDNQEQNRTESDRDHPQREPGQRGDRHEQADRENPQDAGQFEGRNRPPRGEREELGSPRPERDTERNRGRGGEEAQLRPPQDERERGNRNGERGRQRDRNPQAEHGRDRDNGRDGNIEQDRNRDRDRVNHGERGRGRNRGDHLEQDRDRERGRGRHRDREAPPQAGRPAPPPHENRPGPSPRPQPPRVVHEKPREHKLDRALRYYQTATHTASDILYLCESTIWLLSWVADRDDYAGTDYSAAEQAWLDYEDYIWGLWDYLQARYPAFEASLVFVEEEGNRPTAMLLRPGGRYIHFDRNLTYEPQQLWTAADIEDTLADPLAAPYPYGQEGRNPAPGFNPGKAVSLEFLQELFGQTPEDVLKACRTVNFLGRPVKFNARHGAAEALSGVERRLRPILAAHPEYGRYFDQLGDSLPDSQFSGPAGAAFGIGIYLNRDILPALGRNPAPTQAEQVRRAFPQAIIDAFEAEGFIWGGKWSDYDLAYFEFQGRRVD